MKKENQHKNLRKNDENFMKKLAAFNATGKVETILIIGTIGTAIYRAYQGWKLDNYNN